MNILIVDDELIQARSIKRGLKGDQFYCHLAKNADEALQKMVEQALDLVLVDYRMPGTNGLELAKAIREQYPALPIVMMSASDKIDAMDRVLAGAVNGFIRKPFTIEQLKSEIARTISSIAC